MSKKQYEMKLNCKISLHNNSRNIFLLIIILILYNEKTIVTWDTAITRINKCHSVAVATAVLHDCKGFIYTNTALGFLTQKLRACPVNVPQAVQPQLCTTWMQIISFSMENSVLTEMQDQT